MNERPEIGCLFDLDGVIIDSERLYTKIWEAIEIQWPTGIENFAYKIKGTTLEDILDRYFPNPDVQRQVVDELYRLEGLMIYRPLPGAMEFLEALNKAGVPTALVTSSNDKKMAHLWSDMPELKKDFKVVITGDEVEHSKPDPEGYIRAAKAIGVETKHCAVFEDSLQGVKAGRAAGAFVVGVAGTLKAEDISPFCDIVVTSLGEISLKRLYNILVNR